MTWDRDYPCNELPPDSLRTELETTPQYAACRANACLQLLDDSCNLPELLYSGSITSEALIKSKDFYGGRDPRDLPLYNVGEAAAYLRLSKATLNSWVVGRTYPRKATSGYFRPVIQLPSPSDRRLSFYNLIEAHVLRALRTKHSVTLKTVRKALDYAECELGIERLLTSPELRTAGGDLFLEKYGQLIDLSRSGQLAMKKLLENYLRRIEWDNTEQPARFYPFLADEAMDGPRRIVIDPTLSFGRPVLAKHGITVAALAERINAGEMIDVVADDYGLEISEIQEALIYELAA